MHQSSRIEIQCSSCGKNFFIPYSTYADYSGEIICNNCGIRLKIEIVTGLLQYTPKIMKKNIKFQYEKSIVPKTIEHDFYEAQFCFNVGCNKATVVMCRRALEGIVRLKNAQGNDLYQKIKDLKNKGIITEDIYSIVTEIRHLGNYGAHMNEDQLDEITSGDAEIIIDFTNHLIEHIFVMQYKAKVLKSKRKRK